MAIRRMRLEYMILLERLEERAIMIPDGAINEYEDMSPPPSPTILDESLSNSNPKLTRNGLTKRGGKKTKGGSASTGNSGNGSARAQRIRDPDLPKRPTNAYLIFCEMEKERIKQELEEKNPGATMELSKSLTEAWKNLEDEKRKPYYELYEEDRDRYQREMSVYNQKKQIEEELKDPKKLHKKQKLDDNVVDDENTKIPKLETEEKKDETSNSVLTSIETTNNIEMNDDNVVHPSSDAMHIDQSQDFVSEEKEKD